MGSPSRGSKILAEPVESFLEDFSDEDVNVFIKRVQQSTKEVQEMKFLGER